MKILTVNFTAVGLQHIHPHQAMNQIRHAAERCFEFFRRFAGDPRAKTARRHVNKAGFIINLGNIHRRSFTHNRQLECFIKAFWDPCAGGEIIGRSERQNPHRRTLCRISLDKRGRDLIDCAVATACDNGLNAQLAGFFDITCGVTFFPGDANVNNHAVITQLSNCLAQQFVTGTFAVEDQ
ncbi:hypothetical protein D3C78_1106750 [compost metagenome]